METRTNTPDVAAAAGRLFVLSLSEGLVMSMNPDGSGKTTLASDGHMPDGVAIDGRAGHVYWTNMGVPNLDDGSIERCDVDGGNRIVIVPPGVTHTPKQLYLDRTGGKLYWADREGMRVMRCDLDGSHVETLAITGDPVADRGDATKWCVGVALDHARRQIFWTQKGPDNAGLGKILRAGIEVPPGETAAGRSDIEVWCDGLPEPIDLEFDPRGRVLYWTDRGDPPAGNTVNRAGVDAPAPRAPEILIRHLMEGIGLALDLPGERMFITDLGGSIYAARLDGSQAHPIAFAQGNLSGIAYAALPAEAG